MGSELRFKVSQPPLCRKPRSSGAEFELVFQASFFKAVSKLTKVKRMKKPIRENRSKVGSPLTHVSSNGLLTRTHKGPI
jgi:hypothetical protein